MSECPALQNAFNSTNQLISIETVSQTVLSSDGRSVGQTLAIRCRVGYELVGAQLITCQPNLQWDFTTEPYCRKISTPGQQPDEDMALTEKQKLIIGITVGLACLVLIVLAIIIFALCLDKKRRKRRPSIIELKDDSISDYARDHGRYHNGSHPIYLPPRSDDRDYYDDTKHRALPGHSYIQEHDRPRPRSNSFTHFDRPYDRETERYRNYAYEDDRPVRRTEYVEKPRYYDDRYVDRYSSRHGQYEDRMVLSPSSLPRDHDSRRVEYMQGYNDPVYGISSKKNAVINGRDPFLWRPIKTWNNAL